MLKYKDFPIGRSNPGGICNEGQYSLRVNLHGTQCERKESLNESS